MLVTQGAVSVPLNFPRGHTGNNLLLLSRLDPVLSTKGLPLTNKYNALGNPSCLIYMLICLIYMIIAILTSSRITWIGELNNAQSRSGWAVDISAGNCWWEDKPLWEASFPRLGSWTNAERLQSLPFRGLVSLVSAAMTSWVVWPVACNCELK